MSPPKNEFENFSALFRNIFHWKHSFLRFKYVDLDNQRFPVAQVSPIVMVNGNFQELIFCPPQTGIFIQHPAWYKKLQSCHL